MSLLYFSDKKLSFILFLYKAGYDIDEDIHFSAV